ncbi:MAG TPA: zinc-binding dehydrogenase [Anaeromyxobacteraceae bacterium]|nr:zinc-binding dehydrogenase [Anaeromyxobacteraceae bacterium]
MRAAVLAAPGRVDVRDVPLPDPGPGQVRVRVEGCGVCGSNLPLWEGRDWFRYPLAPGAPGHEAWGRVDAVGSDVRAVREGDRVAALLGGAFAEYDVADATTVLSLPPALDALPFPGEPLACGVNVFRRAAIRAGDTVAVVGLGFIGAVAARMAVLAGARVIGIARRGWALDLARRLGVAETVTFGPRAEVVERVRELTGGRLCDAAIEAVGLQEPLDLAAELVREQGRLVIAGFHQDGRRSIDLCAWNWKGFEIVNAHFRDPAVNVEGMRIAADAVARGELDLGVLLTHRYDLAHVGDAFEAMRARPDGFLKGVVIP